MIDIVIAVSCNVQCTRRCYDAILKHTDIPFTIYMVDSTPASMKHEGNQEFENKPKVVYVYRNFTSLAAMWNIGIRAGKNPYVAIINNDAYVSEGWTRLLPVLEDKAVGLVTPIDNIYINERLVAPFKNELLVNLGNYDHRVAEHYKKFKGLRGIYGPGEVLRAFTYKGVENISVPFPLSGAFMVLRREVLEDVGFYDEQYRVYYEDLDMYCKVNQKYTLVSMADQLLFHEHGKTVGPKTGLGSEVMAESGVKFAAKWHPLFERIRRGEIAWNPE